MPRKKTGTRVSKKRVLKPGSQRSYTRKLYSTQLDEPLIAYKRDVKFKKGISHKRGKDFEKTYNSLVKKEMQKFVRANKGKRRGNQYIFRVSISINSKKKRFKQNVGGMRVKIKDEKSLKKYFDRNLKFFIKKMSKYASRTGVKSVTVTGFKGEVIKRGSRSKANQSRRSKKR